ncbi:HupE/UreJ family protein [Parapedobacter indicus]|uniref:HupE / UreJ protein n=1 Tax=Parapedobacter indicus TaxID=1477437 RepID=A0A1I3KSZ3_9SPHI|nr:HupE/UreJ family protein [Parapedobacter indicus]PPL01914.1 HupE/UreJ protein [Parapedobacter indicus]SFI75557.1 HupE / UreJ protein [Parapedobacter indicus]
MQDFGVYFELGLQHILDLAGYDHILFVIALCCTYFVGDWRRVIVLVTAFTIGHSFTLALSVFNLIRVDTVLIEFLIPVTIVITAISNIAVRRKRRRVNTDWLTYGYALFFGLIHGLGFSNYLRSLLGKESSITGPLFAFNVGLELGQLVIVFVVLILSFIATTIFSVSKRDWTFFLSAAVFGIALVMALERI